MIELFRAMLLVLWGTGVPKPQYDTNNKTRWRWDIEDQSWIPTGER